MIHRFFDVVLLGARPFSTLACAALLARRDFRVLVVADGARPATYHYDGLPLRRRAFSPFVLARPAFRRVLAELAQSQAFRRRLVPLEPSLQVLDARRRLSLSADPTALAAELTREVPDMRPAIEALYVHLAELDAQIDGVLAEDALWPPGTFWERRETTRLARLLPAVDELALDAEYRRVVEGSARLLGHESAHDGPLSPLVTARLHRSLLVDPSCLPGDEDELTGFLVERIRAHGGEVRMDESCAGIVHKRGKVTGVVLDGEGETIACNFVIGERPGQRLLERVRDADFEPPDPAAAPSPHERRFVVSLVVRRALVPAPLARHSLLLPARSSDPEVHLTRTQAVGAGTSESADSELWVAEALLPDKEFLPLRAGDLRGRERVLATVRAHFPFLDSHLLVVDSPHDGGPILDGREGGLRAVPRSEVRATGGSKDAEPAEPLYALPRDPYAGLCGEPIRTALEGLLTVSPSVMPTLGAEGELISAWGAARLVTKTDPKRERMRRELWSKIEL